MKKTKKPAKEKKIKNKLDDFVPRNELYLLLEKQWEKISDKETEINRDVVELITNHRMEQDKKRLDTLERMERLGEIVKRHSVEVSQEVGRRKLIEDKIHAIKNIAQALEDLIKRVEVLENRKEQPPFSIVVIK